MKKQKFSLKNKNNSARLIFLNLQILSEFKLHPIHVIELKNIKTFKANIVRNVRHQNIKNTPQLRFRKCKLIEVQGQKVQHFQIKKFKLILKFELAKLRAFFTASP